MDASMTDAASELQFRCQVDAAHCDRAAQGMRLMAQYQYRTLARRYAESGWLQRCQRGARRVAPALALLVLATGLFAAWQACTDPSHRVLWFALAAILLAEALALWLLPRRADGVARRLRRGFETRFGHRAAARLRKARQAAPFEAVYDLRGDLLTYCRVQDGQWTQLWHRKLAGFRPRGVALRTPGLLAIFRKPGHVMPAVIMLIAQDDAMAAAIRALGWTIVDLDPATGEPAAPADPVPADAR
jgi:hypothetical protein